MSLNSPVCLMNAVFFRAGQQNIAHYNLNECFFKCAFKSRISNTSSYVSSTVTDFFPVVPTCPFYHVQNLSTSSTIGLFLSSQGLQIQSNISSDPIVKYLLKLSKQQQLLPTNIHWKQRIKPLNKCYCIQKGW